MYRITGASFANASVDKYINYEKIIELSPFRLSVVIAARIMLNIRDPVVSQPQVDRILGPRGENTHLFSDLRFTISSIIEGQALEP